MVLLRNVQNFGVTDRVERKRHDANGQNCCGEAYATRSERVQHSKHFNSHAKRRRTSATTQSTTGVCSSEKRMQAIARWALGKNHSSQSTKKTAKTNSRTTENMTTRLTLKQVGGIYKGSRENPADNYVVVTKVGSNPLEDEQLAFSAFFKVWGFVNSCYR